MEPEASLLPQELDILFEVVKQVLAALDASPDLFVEESSNLEENPESRYYDGIVNEEPKTLHRSNSCCARTEEDGTSPGTSGEDAVSRLPQRYDELTCAPVRIRVVPKITIPASAGATNNELLRGRHCRQKLW